MRLAVIFLLTAVSGCVLDGVNKQMLKHGGFDGHENKIETLLGRMRELEDIVRNQVKAMGKIEVLEETIRKQAVAIGRVEVLEEMVKKQASLIENILSENQQRLEEKQSLKTRDQLQETLFPQDAVRQSLQLREEILDSQKQKPGVFVRSDDSDPLLPVVTQLTQKVNEVSAGLQALKTEVSASQQELKNEVTEASTSVFVRWGSSTCPGSAALVYFGVIGGSFFNSSGAAADYLCLPLSNLTLINISVYKQAELYGGEYETVDEHYEKDPLCAVCRSSRATNVMIPATTVCPAGWTSEYSGWLMTGNPPHNAASEFVCVDSKMEERAGSEVNNNGKLLYYTVTVCGSLPCPPYINGQRVTCVVCSK